MAERAYRRGLVICHGIHAGLIEETDNGYRFVYDPEYLARPDARPVSLTMPLSASPCESKTLFPFFDGLIPEGWLLDIVTRNWKVDMRDRFGLLLVCCRDTIGAVGVEADHA